MKKPYNSSRYEEAIEIDPNYAEAWYYRALVNIRTGNKENASEDLKMALLIDHSRYSKMATEDEQMRTLVEDVSSFRETTPNETKRTTIWDFSYADPSPTWDMILQLVKERRVTPFIGAGVNDGANLFERLARKWAKEYDYPLLDSYDLTRVSQFMAYRRMDPKFFITHEFENTPDFSRPDEPYAILADLDLPIYVTTNYDEFMEAALRSRGKNPDSEFCRWNEFLRMTAPPSVFDNPEYQPSQDKPLVYHLYGCVSEPHSIVLTTDDYVNFLFSMSRDPLLFPAFIITSISSSSLLFLGYNIFDQNFDILFRFLKKSLTADLGYPVIIQSSPNGDRYFPEMPPK